MPHEQAHFRAATQPLLAVWDFIESTAQLVNLTRSWAYGHGRKMEGPDK